MAYEAPSITSAGLTIPSFSDILNDLIAQAQSIFGQNIYLGNDSADYQFLSIVALKISDNMNAIQLAYNNRGPLTAIGSGLDGVIANNGLIRKVPSYSTCNVNVTGTPLTVISNGVVQDTDSNNLWDLPSPITISAGGSINVTATCQALGAITAGVGSLSQIMTPTQGWSSVTNAAAAIAGQPIEADSQLRSRQAVSTMLPSETLFAGTVAAIASLEGVTRYQCYENYTGSTDSNGCPSHSIYCVVEGGTEAAIAQAIYNNKSTGCGTWGTTTVTVQDQNFPGITAAINFYLPTYMQINVVVNVHLLSGGTTATLTAIKTAIVNYLNSLQIGVGLSLSTLEAAAVAVNPNLSSPIFSIQSITAGAQGGVSTSTLGSNAGTGYQVNDIVTLTQAGGWGATIKVLTLSGSAVATYSQLTPGNNYTVANNTPTSGGHGTGLTIDITAIAAPAGTVDIPVAFDEVTQGITANVTVNSV